MAAMYVNGRKKGDKCEIHQNDSNFKHFIYQFYLPILSEFQLQNNSRRRRRKEKSLTKMFLKILLKMLWLIGIILSKVNVSLTIILVNLVQQFSISRQLRKYYKVLMISSHGITWLIINLVLHWINNSNLYQMLCNLVLGIYMLFNTIFVLKDFKATSRPSANVNLFLREFFPSGNAAHVAFITYFFLYLWPVPSIFVPLLLAWSFSVCMSKLLIRRNYIGNILTGIGLGILQGMLLECIYVDQETCTRWITGEKTSGAEYDV